MQGTKVKFRHSLFPYLISSSRTPPFLRFWIKKPYDGVYCGVLDLFESKPLPGDLLIAGVRLDDEGTGDVVHYGVYPDQPAQDVMINLESWKTWCFTKHEIVKLAKHLKLIQESVWNG